MPHCTPLGYATARRLGKCFLHIFDPGDKLVESFYLIIYLIITISILLIFVADVPKSVRGKFDVVSN
jgi:hypothetical protein